jgi:hypothetical protein
VKVERNMRNIITLFITMLTILPACATTPKQRAIQFVVASDAVADELGDGWGGYVDDEIARCRASLSDEADTPDEREKCLGYAAKGDALELAMEALVVSQVAVEVAVTCESNPLKVPKEFLHKCAEPADWQALEQGVFNAWQNIRPYYEAMLKARKS